MKFKTLLAPVLLAAILVSCTQQTSKDTSAAAPDDQYQWNQRFHRTLIKGI